MLYILLLCVSLISCYPANAVNTPRPDVYIISLQKHRDYEGREVWYLQYALDGKIEQAVFYSADSADEYIEYLKDMGRRDESVKAEEETGGRN
jgi:hypothetical protein